MDNSAEAFKKLMMNKGEAALDAVMEGKPEQARKLGAELLLMQGMKQEIQQLAREVNGKELKG